MQRNKRGNQEARAGCWMLGSAQYVWRVDSLYSIPSEAGFGGFWGSPLAAWDRSSGKLESESKGSGELVGGWEAGDGAG